MTSGSYKYDGEGSMSVYCVYLLLCLRHTATRLIPCYILVAYDWYRSGRGGADNCWADSE